MKAALEKTPLCTLWWHAIDRWSFIALMILSAVGAWLIMAVSPAVALQHQWNAFVLLKRHFLMMGPGLLLLTAHTFFEKNTLVKSAYIIGFIAWISLLAVLVAGVEIKGARRWLLIGGFSLQPSEFLKPALAMITAHILATTGSFFLSGIVVFIAIFPLFLQPDLGMIFLLCIGWFSQCFIAEIPWKWVAGLGIGALTTGASIILLFPHALYRLQVFLSEETHDPFGSHFQITQALKGFASGGFWGKGPGAGTILNHLPDGHADFIFAVAGEELGLLMCLLIVGLYALVIFRGFWFIFQEPDLFYRLSSSGLILQFSFQILLNLASVLKMIPTKGVTLPFLSYGGSSFLSLCWGMGMLLALTRRYRQLL